MNIPQYFGSILSEKTGLSAVPCAGLIRLSIKQAGKNPDNISVRDLKNVFQDQLRERLERLNMKDINNLVRTLVMELIKTQSIIAMSVT
ncbi:MAG: hypothetical protein JW891_10585 [Candidatus Lokiarchaeota archaeon]|nr:hypothetical protein [Candidatus Lokiarchaeota archaeon]